MSALQLARVYGEDDLFRQVVDGFLPENPHHGARKRLSRLGACLVTDQRAPLKIDYHDHITGNDYRDLGNWVYACAGHFLAWFLNEDSKLYYWMQHVNDEKLGDIFEAVLGICWAIEIEPLGLPERMRIWRAAVESFLWDMNDLQVHIPGWEVTCSRQYVPLLLRSGLFVCN